jgi:hypothetical protein
MQGPTGFEMRTPRMICPDRAMIGGASARPRSARAYALAEGAESPPTASAVAPSDVKPPMTSAKAASSIRGRAETKAGDVAITAAIDVRHTPSDSSIKG